MIDAFRQPASRRFYRKVLAVFLIVEARKPEHASCICRCRVAAEPSRQTPQEIFSILMSNALYAPDHLIFPGRCLQHIIWERYATILVNCCEPLSPIFVQINVKMAYVL